MFEGQSFSQAAAPSDALAVAGAGAGTAPGLDPEQLAAQWQAWQQYAAGYQMQMAAAYGLYGGAYGGAGLTAPATQAPALPSVPSLPAPVPETVTPDVVDRFIADNHLDDSAGRLLRSERPEVQAAVIHRGTLADCRNPSSAVMGRLRDAKASVAAAAESRGDARGGGSAGGGGGGGGGASEVLSGAPASGSLVDRFIADNRLDDTAARLLRCESPEIQSAVVERGSLVDCHNPSSAVMGRIRDAKSAARTGQLPSTSTGAMDTSDVDRFIVQNRLDTGAARVLKEEAAEVQRAVMERGPVAECSNPSAAIMGRINDAKGGGGPGGDLVGVGLGAAGLGAPGLTGPAFGAPGLAGAAGGLPQLGAAQFGLGGLLPPLGQLGQLGQFAQLGQLGPLGGQFGAPPLMQPPTGPSPPGMLPQLASPLGPALGMPPPDLAGAGAGAFPVAAHDDMDLERFIREGRIDTSAEKALRGESREIQMAVMMKGGLENCVNPSSAVMGRINEARQLARSNGLLPPVSQRRHDSRDPTSIEDFIADNNLDDNCARALRMESAEVQQNVMERGTLADCFNASAAVMRRIKDFKQRPPPTSTTGGASRLSASGLPLPSREQVEDFIRENPMDDNAARALRTENPDVQAEVLERGTLADCINASAAVMGRIKDGKMKKEAARKGGSGAGVPSAGPGGSSTAGAGAGGGAAPAGTRSAPVTQQEVQEFIAENKLDDSAARALMAVPPDIQANVMDRGSLSVTMNPSSAVMGRIRDAKQAANAARGGGGSGGYGSRGAPQQQLPQQPGFLPGLPAGFGLGMLDPGTSSLLNYGAALGLNLGDLRASPY